MKLETCLSPRSGICHHATDRPETFTSEAANHHISVARENTERGTRPVGPEDIISFRHLNTGIAGVAPFHLAPDTAQKTPHIGVFLHTTLGVMRQIDIKNPCE